MGKTVLSVSVVYFTGIIKENQLLGINPQQF
jgi:hypothetical protein